jgi:hypothetical protein
MGLKGTESVRKASEHSKVIPEKGQLKKKGLAAIAHRNYAKEPGFAVVFPNRFLSLVRRAYAFKL